MAVDHAARVAAGVPGGRAVSTRPLLRALVVLGGLLPPNLPSSGYVPFITGFFSGFLLAAFTASQWHLIVSGKPVIALVPFFIVGFEFTILFAIFGNVVGLIHQMRLPEFKGLEQYDPRCSGHHFGVTVSCKADDLERLKLFFQNKGGDVKVISNGSV